MMRGLPHVLAATALAACACRGPAEPTAELVRRAQFGVLFGGQIQERKEIPFVLDRARQQIGLRVEFVEPLRSDVSVEWRLDRPPLPAARKAPKAATPLPATAPTTIGRGVARAGSTRFDQTLALVPGDPLGTWKVRVTVQGKAVVDRAFDLFDPAERARRPGADAGL